MIMLLVLRPGHITHPMPTGRALLRKTIETCKKKKKLNLQVFSRIGKTMRKLQSIQLLFEEHLILDTKTTFRLQKHLCENI